MTFDKPYCFGATGACVAAVLASSLGVALAKGGDTDTFSLLVGRWAGQGTVISAAGTAEAFKCVVTYVPAKDGLGHLQQNLRCQSDNYRLDAATVLKFEGQRVSGCWVDNVNALDGEVAGQLTKDGFDVILSGRFFQAKMAVSSQGCDQSVRVLPATADYIREVSAKLKRC